jgi:hypothetical protein
MGTTSTPEGDGFCERLARQDLRFGPTFLAAMALSMTAYADAIGPVEPRTDCPRGAHSVEIGGGHGHFAACAPSLAREDWPCTDGRRIEVRGLVLSSRFVGPEWDGRRGPMPPEMRSMGNHYLVAEEPCDAPADAPLVQAPEAARGEGTIGTGAMSAAGLPMGCQRVCVWVLDEAFACAPPAPPPPPPTPTPARAATPSAPVSGCNCASAPRGDTGAVFVAIAVACVTLRRQRSRGRRAPPAREAPARPHRPLGVATSSSPRAPSSRA